MPVISPAFWIKFDRQSVLQPKPSGGVEVNHRDSVDRNAAYLLLEPVDRLSFYLTRERFDTLKKAPPAKRKDALKGLLVGVGKDMGLAASVPFLISKDLFDIGLHAAARNAKAF